LPKDVGGAVLVLPGLTERLLAVVGNAPLFGSRLTGLARCKLYGVA